MTAMTINMKMTLPIILGLCFIGAGLASAQVTFEFGGFSTYDLSGTSLTMPNMSLLGFQQNGTPALQILSNGSLTAVLNGSGIDSGFQGTAAFSGSTDDLMIQLGTTSATYNGSTYSVSGNWSYTNGTGTYAHLTGSGTFSGTLNPNSSQYAITTFGGTLQPQAVPSPSSFAFLGMGLLGLALRRKK